jgi:hypothetical protein
MKYKLSIMWLLLNAIASIHTAAQTSSTEANPKWYYIQVRGIGPTAAQVLTNVDGQVLGQNLATTDVVSISKQLWRFEISSGGYRVINKYSKQQLTVVFDAAANVRRPALTDNSPTSWSFIVSATSGYKYVGILNEPQEGTQGEIYLSQTRYNNNALKLVSAADRTSDNELFRCVLNEMPITSTDEATLWMTIRNPKTNKYLTDAVASAPGVHFTLEAANNAQSQQWKILAKDNGNVEFVNRATGNMIATETYLNKYYYVNYTTDPAGNTGWQYALAGGSTGQYVVSTTDAGGVDSYWNATTDGQAVNVYSPGNTANSTYAWIFTWVDEVYTGINRPVFLPDNIRVYALNRRIYVDGCDDYRITAISGMPMRKNTDLPAGIYLVTVKDKTTKILVK